MSVRRYFLPRTLIRYFGHSNIIKYCKRPFLCQYDKDALAREGSWTNGDWRKDNESKHRISLESVQIMDDTLIANINKVVGENDVLYHLGDFCFGVKKDLYRKAKEYRDRIKCRNIHLIWGNHDAWAIRDLFSSTNDCFDALVNDQLIVLHHYAKAIWDRSHHGAWHLYGHSHAGAEQWLDANMPGRRSFDAGVDNAVKLIGEYRPFSFDEVKSIMSKRNGFSMDHHVQRENKR